MSRILAKKRAEVSDESGERGERELVGPLPLLRTVGAVAGVAVSELSARDWPVAGVCGGSLKTSLVVDSWIGCGVVKVGVSQWLEAADTCWH